MGSQSLKEFLLQKHEIYDFLNEQFFLILIRLVIRR